jgi:hypothetical protein
MKPTNALSKTDALREMQDIARTLKKAGDLYRNSRSRNGIYDFLHAAYAVYWVLKRRGHIARQKKLLRLAAKAPASKSRRLSELVLLVAAEACDRRDRHRWKKLLEAAVQRRVHPKELVGELKTAHGVNKALKLWSTPAVQPSMLSPTESSTAVHESNSIDVQEVS